MLHYFNISLEKWKTHQNPNSFGFACSAAGLFPLPFGGPFDGPLPAPFVATTGAWECIDTEKTENEYGWIWLNNMHLNETDANWIQLKLSGGKWMQKWMQMDQSFAGFQRTWKDIFYQNYLNSQGTNSPTLLESAAMCNFTT